MQAKPAFKSQLNYQEVMLTMPDFVPDLSIILAFGAATLVLAITPGPDMAYFISRTVNYGKPHGVAAIFGALSGLFAHTVLAAFGVSVLLALAPTAFFALKIIGSLYLFWLAIQAIRANGGITLQNKIGKTPSLAQSYFTGLGINLTNPKIILFFVTFLPQFVSQTDAHASGKLLFLGAEFLIVSTPILLSIILMAGWIGNVLVNSVKAQKALNWSFAAVFATFAVTILAVEGKTAL